VYVRRHMMQRPRFRQNWLAICLFDEPLHHLTRMALEQLLQLPFERSSKLKLWDGALAFLATFPVCLGQKDSPFFHIEFLLGLANWTVC
jgi:hypothetical protein